MTVPLHFPLELVHLRHTCAPKLHVYVNPSHTVCPSYVLYIHLNHAHSTCMPQPYVYTLTKLCTLAILCAPAIHTYIHTYLCTSIMHISTCTPWLYCTPKPCTFVYTYISAVLYTLAIHACTYPSHTVLPNHTYVFVHPSHTVHLIYVFICIL